MKIKKWWLIFILAILLVLFSQLTFADCLNLSTGKIDSTQACYTSSVNAGKCNLRLDNTYYTVCKDTYYMNGTNGAVGISNSNITFDCNGSTIINNGSLGLANASTEIGILILMNNQTENVTVKNCILEGFNKSGIWYNRQSDENSNYRPDYGMPVYIENNTIRNFFHFNNSGFGIRLVGANGVYVRNNNIIIQDSAVDTTLIGIGSIKSEKQPHDTIHNHIIENNTVTAPLTSFATYGAYLADVDNSTWKNNRFINTTVGFSIDNWLAQNQPYNQSTSNNQIYNNAINKSLRCFQFVGSSNYKTNFTHNKIYNNYCFDNTAKSLLFPAEDGVSFFFYYFKGEENKLYNNNFKNLDSGIYSETNKSFYPNQQYTHIYNNTFENIKQHLIKTNSFTTKINFSGNVVNNSALTDGFGNYFNLISLSHNSNDILIDKNKLENISIGTAQITYLALLSNAHNITLSDFLLFKNVTNNKIRLEGCENNTIRDLGFTAEIEVDEDTSVTPPISSLYNTFSNLNLSSLTLTSSHYNTLNNISTSGNSLHLVSAHNNIINNSYFSGNQSFTVYDSNNTIVQNSFFHGPGYSFYNSTAEVSSPYGLSFNTLALLLHFNNNPARRENSTFAYDFSGRNNHAELIHSHFVPGSWQTGLTNTTVLVEHEKKLSPLRITLGFWINISDFKFPFVKYLQSNFSQGIYENTFLNNSFVQLNLSHHQGNYTSEIYDAGENVTWANIEWQTPTWELPNYQDGSIMDNNLLLLHLNNDSSYGENNTHVYDFSGNGNNGTASNTQLSSGKFNNSFDFDGVGRINCSNTNFGDKDLSVSLWFKIKADTDSIPLFNYGNTDYNLFADDTSNHYLKWRLDGTVVNQYNIDWNHNQWYHVAATWDGSTAKMYIDGQEVDSDSHFGMNLDHSNALIGSWNGVSLNGSIDEVAVWNRSLSADEIEELYRRGANKLNISVRSCDDPLCDTEIFSDVGTLNGSTDLNLPVNRYFQYKAHWKNIQPELNNVSAQLWNVTIGHNKDLPLITKPGIYNLTINNTGLVFSIKAKNGLHSVTLPKENLTGWTMTAFVYNGLNLTAYSNAQPITTNTKPKGMLNYRNQDNLTINIGKFTLDEFFLYSHDLTKSEVYSELYNISLITYSYGLILNKTNHNNIINNTFHNHTFGIYTYNTKNSTFQRNNFSDNAVGSYLTHTSRNNSFHYNVFNNNIFHLFNGQKKLVNATHNYWSSLDCQEIDEKLFDRGDHWFAGFIQYQPFCSNIQCSAFQSCPLYTNNTVCELHEFVINGKCQPCPSNDEAVNLESYQLNNH